MHAIDRASERYGVVLDEGGLLHLEVSIVAGRSICLQRNTETELHIVGHKGVALVAVYLRGPKVIATFLPPEAARNGLTRGAFLRAELSNAYPAEFGSARSDRQSANRAKKRANSRTKFARQYEQATYEDAA